MKIILAMFLLLLGIEKNRCDFGILKWLQFQMRLLILDYCGLGTNYSDLDESSQFFVLKYSTVEMLLRYHVGQSFMA